MHTLTLTAPDADTLAKARAVVEALGCTVKPVQASLPLETAGQPIPARDVAIIRTLIVVKKNEPMRKRELHGHGITRAGLYNAAARNWVTPDPVALTDTGRRVLAAYEAGEYVPAGLEAARAVSHWYHRDDAGVVKPNKGRHPAKLWKGPLPWEAS